MLKQSKDYPISAKLELELDESSAVALASALSDSIRSGDRVSTSIERKGGNLYISIKAKDTNILRAVIGNYISAINTIEEIDKL